MQIFWNNWIAQLNQKSSLKIQYSLINLLAAKYEKWANIWCQLITKSDLIAGINFSISGCFRKGMASFSILVALLLDYIMSDYAF